MLASMRRAIVLLGLVVAGCGGSTTTVIESQTSTETQTVERTVTTPAPLPEPDPSKTVSCQGGQCTQDGAVVDFKYGSSSAAQVGDLCGKNGTWQDAGTDPKTGAGLYKCVEGPAP